MRVLLVHNYYQQRGGEDAVVEAEAELLRQNGHDVELYSRTNADVIGMSRLSLAKDTVWSARTERDLREVLGAFAPEIMHVHNTLPLISGSAFWAAGAAGVPVVQTLHNFRLFCPQAMFLRAGRICEDCMGRVPWRAVVHGCYRDSRAQSAALVAALGAHRLARTSRHVTRFIALNRFCREKFIEGGLPPERISIKPNFASIPTPGSYTRQRGLFIGRLAPEKGIGLLASALARAERVQIDVVGEGPEAESVRGCRQMQWAGWLPSEEVYRRMAQAAYLVMPSLWYENFPRTLVEAFACGLPVIASRLGALEELVEDGRTGLHFTPGDSADLARKLMWAESNPDAMRRMGLEARREYERRYTPEVNYARLIEIYEEARTALRLGEGRQPS
jgi:glycosyltransferase involved in cell wall biosynthesis